MKAKGIFQKCFLFWISLLAISCQSGVFEDDSGYTNGDSQADGASHCDGRMVLVTGATGRVGGMVTDMLVDQGYCVRVFSRSAKKAKEKFGQLWHNKQKNGAVVELAVGDLGDGTSVAKAFLPQESSDGVAVSHIVFAAGGEEADYDAVNNRGVAECAVEASKAGSKSMVVISAAWVSKPYSLASLLFNSLYDNLPMAKHLQGEDALRNATTGDSTFSYVILRAGRLVPDNEYPVDAASGLSYGQGDSFSFFGPAGQPGMCNTQLANAVMTALNVEGKYTVEVTGGTVGAKDTTVYGTFAQDGLVKVSYEDVGWCHAKALFDLKLGAVIFSILTLTAILFVASPNCWDMLQGLLVFLLGFVLFVAYWTIMLSSISVLDCASRGGSSSSDL